MLLRSVLRDLFRNKAKGEAALLSVIVNFHNNRREAENTLYSLSRRYQSAAHDIPYEVIALDHASTQPLSESDVHAFGPEFQYRYVSTESVSPAQAINAACRDAAGDRLLVVTDGAHILSPGILKLVAEAFRQFVSPFVATVPFHLGPKIQNLSVQEGYNQQIEDRLLEDCRWRENGYRLYVVAGAFADGSCGWYGQLFESGCFAMRKRDYLALGGFDERFVSPGGGLMSLDLFQRALITRDLNYVVLLGEGTFHQVHGGVATNAPEPEHPWPAFLREYTRIRGHAFMRVRRKPRFLGEVPEEAVHIAEFSRRAAEEIWRKHPATIQ